MNAIERFQKLMNFEPVDRLPQVEWAPYWDKTIDRWFNEGLPESLARDVEGIRKWFGLDSYSQVCIRHGWLEKDFKIRDSADYDSLVDHLYCKQNFLDERHQDLKRRHDSGDTVLWLTFSGFFWYPRYLFGIEAHLYAFYDEPELMHRMNQDLVDYHLQILDQFCREVGAPEFMTFAEDMSYNHGPMLGKDLFDEFLAPYYRQMIPALKERGIRVFVDSDGDVTDMIPWLKEVGIEGLLPWERQSGVDVVKIREQHPDFRMIGAFDKMCMPEGEEAMRREFERLLPLMRQGGFIPSVDHQTPPSVSMENYRIFLRLLKEYTVLATDKVPVNVS